MTVILSDDSRKSFEMPITIYQGVYEEGYTYDVHDMVTFGGSVWVRTGADDGLRPSMSKAWKLAVKHGRDGRDAKGAR
jgi:integrin beta 3